MQFWTTKKRVNFFSRKKDQTGGVRGGFGKRLFTFFCRHPSLNWFVDYKIPRVEGSYGTNDNNANNAAQKKLFVATVITIETRQFARLWSTISFWLSLGIVAFRFCLSSVCMRSGRVLGETASGCFLDFFLPLDLLFECDMMFECGLIWVIFSQNFSF